MERLGLGRCYHMHEVFANPGHAALWAAAVDGAAVDWDAIFAGYGAAVDAPASPMGPKSRRIPAGSMNADLKN